MIDVLALDPEQSDPHQSNLAGTEDMTATNYITMDSDLQADQLVIKTLPVGMGTGRPAKILWETLRLRHSLFPSGSALRQRAIPQVVNIVRLAAQDESSRQRLERIEAAEQYFMPQNHQNPHHNLVYSLQFSPKGSLLVAARYVQPNASILSAYWMTS